MGAEGGRVRSVPVGGLRGEDIARGAWVVEQANGRGRSERLGDC